eukprot:gene50804-biopygen35787
MFYGEVVFAAAVETDDGDADIAVGAKDPAPRTGGEGGGGAREQGAVFAYGSFLTILINFLIVAWIIFLVVKAVNRAMPKKEAEPAPLGPPADIVLLTEIRDTLRAKP